MARSGITRLLFALALFASAASTRSTSAQSHDPRQEITSADDFRVRVGAALALGRSRSGDARPYLEKGLADPHPTVRTASAAALSALRDPAAIPALERRLASESSGSVRSQLSASIAALRGTDSAAAAPATAPAKARYAVQLGAMKNLSGVRGTELGNVLRVSAQRRISELQGAVVVDENGATTRPKGVPTLLLDGSLTKLAQQSQANGGVSFTARVEFTVRKVPENTLKGALSGAATSLGTAKSAAVRNQLIALQDQAVEGAVESAMRGASEGLSQAAR